MPEESNQAILVEIERTLRLKRKPFNTTEKWRIATGLNPANGPCAVGRGAIEMVSMYGGKRKPRKKG